MKSILVKLAPIAAALALAACAAGPDFHHPAAPDAKGYQPGALPATTADAGPGRDDHQRFASGADIPAQWWALFHSQPLDDLVTQSLKANPTVASAQAALRAARENTLAQRGAFFPSVSAEVDPTRQRIASALASPAASASYLYNLTTAQVDISFVPDVFGGNRRAIESLEAQEESQRFQLEATLLTLSTNVVDAAIQDASLRAQVAATQEIIREQTETLDSFHRQFGAGQLARADVATQEASLAQAQSMLPPLQKQLEQQRDLILALAGRLPDQDGAPAFELSSLHLPDELPVSLPSKLVEQRPDVRAAEAQMHTASAQVGVAVANRLPNFSIDASYGRSSDHFDKLLSGGNAFWNLAGNITQPIFNAGTLKHRQRAAEAAYDEAAAQYRSTVITAFQNVADTLHAIQADADAMQAAVRAEQAAKTSLAITRRRFELGDASHLAVLAAQQTWQQAELALIQAQANRLQDSVALFQALGGGWWNRAADAKAGL